MEISQLLIMLQYTNKKASKSIHFLKDPKQSGLSTEELFCTYKLIIQPISERTCQVWSTSLTKGQNKRD